MTSNREKKRIVKEGVAALRARPGWDPAKHASDSPVRAAVQADRTAQIYDAAATCERCHRERAATGDPTALCDEHLALAAMGR